MGDHRVEHDRNLYPPARPPGLASRGIRRRDSESRAVGMGKYIEELTLAYFRNGAASLRLAPTGVARRLLCRSLRRPSIRQRNLVLWRQLAWVAWRRYRLALVSTAGLLALLAVSLVISGEHMRTAYDALPCVCTPTDSAEASLPRRAVSTTSTARPTSSAPLLLACSTWCAFVGAPLVARELESGTFRFAWTQGVV